MANGSASFQRVNSLVNGSPQPDADTDRFGFRHRSFDHGCVLDRITSSWASILGPQLMGSGVRRISTSLAERAGRIPNCLIQMDGLNTRPEHFLFGFLRNARFKHGPQIRFRGWAGWPIG